MFIYYFIFYFLFINFLIFFKDLDVEDQEEEDEEDENNNQEKSEKIQDENSLMDNKVDRIWNRLWKYAQTFKLGEEQWWCILLSQSGVFRTT